MILEGIVTTLNEDGSANLAPMGPLVDEQMMQFVLRPYRSSATYTNLKRHGEGVLHVTDDVELIARAAVGQLATRPKLKKAHFIRGFVVADACRWYEFRVASLADQGDRTTIACDVVGRGRIRDFFGFNRAKHAVLEAAIMATRLQLLPSDQIRDELQRLGVIVEKTAGAQERRAFEFLTRFIGEQLSQSR